MRHEDTANNLYQPSKIQGPVLYIFGCTVILAIFGFFWPWRILSTSLQTEISDYIKSVAPILQLFAIVLIVVGWSESARRNAEEAQRIEKLRQARAREGTLRQIRTLLRYAIYTIDRFLPQFTPNDFDMISNVHTQFIERLNDRETAIALADNEYDSIDAFVRELGDYIPVASHRAQAYNPAESYYVCLRDIARIFNYILRFLRNPVELFGDEGIATKFLHLEENMRTNATRSPEEREQWVHENYGEIYPEYFDNIKTKPR